ncbi:MAG: UbiA family prenyltransferase [Hamadaea sp.]|nr:UbiA family prenyltransferase [Hamadaea sp.]
MSRLEALLRCCHPAPAAAVTVLSGMLALAAGHDLRGILLVVGVIGLSQIAVAWANDAIDADRDRAVGRTDKPLAHAWPEGRAVVAFAAITASLAMIALALAAPVLAAVAAIVGLLSGHLYNWPLKATPLSIAPYLVSFAAIPAFILASAPLPVPDALIASAACFGGAAHMLNAVPDLAQDAATGVRGLPQRLGERRARTVGAALTFLAVFALL